jgi:hypothetical protein
MKIESKPQAALILSFCVQTALSETETAETQFRITNGWPSMEPAIDP